LKQYTIEADQVYTFPMDRYYWKGDTPHVWAKPEGEDTFRLGFDQFAQRLAGPILYARTRAEGKLVKQGKSFGTVETAKWVGPLRCPFTGTIIEVNEKLKEKPELINEDPYDGGWIVVLKTDPDTFDKEKNVPEIIQIGDVETFASFMDEELKKAGFKKR